MTIFKNAFLVAACSASTCFADCGLEPFALPFENAEVIADTAMNATPSSVWKSAEGIPVDFKNGKIDMLKFVSGEADKGTAMLRAQFKVADPGAYAVGVGGDWYITVWLNGEKILDLDRTGNRKTPFAIDNHAVFAELNSGTHTLDIRLRRGAKGAFLTAGVVPAEKMIAKKRESEWRFVDFSKASGGKLRLLNGVNNGPRRMGGKDLTAAWKKIGVSGIRLHDSNGTFSSVVDVHAVFPLINNPKADPDDPANYTFERTDEYMHYVMGMGVDVIYRLGASIEWSDGAYGAVKPADYDQWTRVCANIIRHYTQGWKNGFHYPIRKWEIWNEPESHGLMFANGTDEDFYRLYVHASKELKRLFPDLLIGGAAVTSPCKPFFRKFLDYVKAEGAPLDFASWHIYSRNVQDVVEWARIARRELDSRGFEKTLSICDEWNFEPGCNGVNNIPPEVSATAFRLMQGEQAAAFCLETLLRMQNEKIDMMHYYDGQIGAKYCGLFDLYGAPGKVFYAFQTFHYLSKFPAEVETSAEREHVYMRAFADEKMQEAAVVLIKSGSHGNPKNPYLKGDTVTLQIAGLPAGINEYEIIKTDRENNGERIQVSALPDAPVRLLNLFSPDDSIILIRFYRANNDYGKCFGRE